MKSKGCLFCASFFQEKVSVGQGFPESFTKSPPFEKFEKYPPS